MKKVSPMTQDVIMEKKYILQDTELNTWTIQVAPTPFVVYKLEILRHQWKTKQNTASSSVIHFNETTHCGSTAGADAPSRLPAFVVPFSTYSVTCFFLQCGTGRFSEVKLSYTNRWRKRTPLQGPQPMAHPYWGTSRLEHTWPRWTGLPQCLLCTRRPSSSEVHPAEWEGRWLHPWHLTDKKRELSIASETNNN